MQNIGITDSHCFKLLSSEEWTRFGSWGTRFSNHLKVQHNEASNKASLQEAGINFLPNFCLKDYFQGIQDRKQHASMLWYQNFSHLMVRWGYQLPKMWMPAPWSPSHLEMLLRSLSFSDLLGYIQHLQRTAVSCVRFPCIHIFVHIASRLSHLLKFPALFSSEENQHNQELLHKPVRDSARCLMGRMSFHLDNISG